MVLISFWRRLMAVAAAATNARKSLFHAHSAPEMTAFALHWTCTRATTSLAAAPLDMCEGDYFFGCSSTGHVTRAITSLVAAPLDMCEGDYFFGGSSEHRSNTRAPGRRLMAAADGGGCGGGRRACGSSHLCRKIIHVTFPEALHDNYLNFLDECVNF